VTPWVLLPIIALALFGAWQSAYVDAYLARTGGPDGAARHRLALSDPIRYIRQTVAVLGRPSIYLRGSEDPRLESLRRQTLWGVALFVVSCGAWFFDSVVTRNAPEPGMFMIFASAILAAWLIVLALSIRRRNAVQMAIAGAGILASSVTLLTLFARGLAP
jgi:hypothetical protein